MKNPNAYRHTRATFQQSMCDWFLEATSILWITDQVLLFKICLRFWEGNDALLESFVRASEYGHMDKKIARKVLDWFRSNTINSGISQLLISYWYAQLENTLKSTRSSRRGIVNILFGYYATCLLSLAVSTAHHVPDMLMCSRVNPFTSPYPRHLYLNIGKAAHPKLQQCEAVIEVNIVYRPRYRVLSWNSRQL